MNSTRHKNSTSRRTRSRSTTGPSQHSSSKVKPLLKKDELAFHQTKRSLTTHKVPSNSTPLLATSPHTLTSQQSTSILTQTRRSKSSSISNNDNYGNGNNHHDDFESAGWSNLREMNDDSFSQHLNELEKDRPLSPAIANFDPKRQNGEEVKKNSLFNRNDNLSTEEQLQKKRLYEQSHQRRIQATRESQSMQTNYYITPRSQVQTPTMSTTQQESPLSQHSSTSLSKTQQSTSSTPHTQKHPHNTNHKQPTQFKSYGNTITNATGYTDQPFLSYEQYQRTPLFSFSKFNNALVSPFLLPSLTNHIDLVDDLIKRHFKLQKEYDHMTAEAKANGRQFVKEVEKRTWNDLIAMQYVFDQISLDLPTGSNNPQDLANLTQAEIEAGLPPSSRPFRLPGESKGSDKHNKTSNSHIDANQFLDTHGIASTITSPTSRLRQTKANSPNDGKFINPTTARIRQLTPLYTTNQSDKYLAQTPEQLHAQFIASLPSTDGFEFPNNIFNISSVLTSLLHQNKIILSRQQIASVYISTIQKHFPDAHGTLYGSIATGLASPDCDCDISLGGLTPLSPLNTPHIITHSQRLTTLLSHLDQGLPALNWDSSNSYSQFELDHDASFDRYTLEHLQHEHLSTLIQYQREHGIVSRHLLSSINSSTSASMSSKSSDVDEDVVGDNNGNTPEETRTRFKALLEQFSQYPTKFSSLIKSFSTTQHKHELAQFQAEEDERKITRIQERRREKRKRRAKREWEKNNPGQEYIPTGDNSNNDLDNYLYSANNDDCDNDDSEEGDVIDAGGEEVVKPPVQSKLLMKNATSWAGETTLPYDTLRPIDQLYSKLNGNLSAALFQLQMVMHETLDRKYSNDVDDALVFKDVTHLYNRRQNTFFTDYMQLPQRNRGSSSNNTDYNEFNDGTGAVLDYSDTRGPNQGGGVSLASNQIHEALTQSKTLIYLNHLTPTQKHVLRRHQIFAYHHFNQRKLQWLTLPPPIVDYYSENDTDDNANDQEAIENEDFDPEDQFAYEEAMEGEMKEKQEMEKKEMEKKEVEKKEMEKKNCLDGGIDDFPQGDDDDQGEERLLSKPTGPPPLTGPLKQLPHPLITVSTQWQEESYQHGVLHKNNHSKNTIQRRKSHLFSNIQPHGLDGLYNVSMQPLPVSPYRFYQKKLMEWDSYSGRNAKDGSEVSKMPKKTHQLKIPLPFFLSHSHPRDIEPVRHGELSELQSKLQVLMKSTGFNTNGTLPGHRMRIPLLKLTFPKDNISTFTLPKSPQDDRFKASISHRLPVLSTPNVHMTALQDHHTSIYRTWFESYRALLGSQRGLKTLKSYQDSYKAKKRLINRQISSGDNRGDGLELIGHELYPINSTVVGRENNININHQDLTTPNQIDLLSLSPPLGFTPSSRVIPDAIRDKYKVQMTHRLIHQLHNIPSIEQTHPRLNPFFSSSIPISPFVDPSSSHSLSTATTFDGDSDGMGLLYGNSANNHKKRFFYYNHELSTKLFWDNTIIAPNNLSPAIDAKSYSNIDTIGDIEKGKITKGKKHGVDENVEDIENDTENDAEHENDTKNDNVETPDISTLPTPAPNQYFSLPSNSTSFLHNPLWIAIKFVTFCLLVKEHGVSQSSALTLSGLSSEEHLQTIKKWLKSDDIGTDSNGDYYDNRGTNGASENYLNHIHNDPLLAIQSPVLEFPLKRSTNLQSILNKNRKNGSKSSQDDVTDLILDDSQDDNVEGHHENDDGDHDVFYLAQGLVGSDGNDTLLSNPSKITIPEVATLPHSVNIIPKMLAHQISSHIYKHYDDVKHLEEIFSTLMDQSEINGAFDKQSLNEFISAVTRTPANNQGSDDSDDIDDTAVFDNLSDGESGDRGNHSRSKSRHHKQPISRTPSITALLHNPDIKDIEAAKELQQDSLEDELIANIKDTVEIISQQLNTYSFDPFSFEQDVESDICLQNNLGIVNSALIREYLAIDPRVQPLILMVKEWSKSVNLHGAPKQKLSSYAYTVLSIFYLQQADVLPSLQRYFTVAEESQRVKEGEDRNEGTPSDKVVELSPTGEPLPPLGELNTNSVQWIYQNRYNGFALADEFIGYGLRTPELREKSILDLFSGFLDYYSKFDFTDKVVSIQSGKPISKEYKNIYSWPSVHSHRLGRVEYHNQLRASLPEMEQQLPPTALQQKIKHELEYDLYDPDNYNFENDWIQSNQLLHRQKVLQRREIELERMEREQNIQNNPTFGNTQVIDSISSSLSTTDDNSTGWGGSMEHVALEQVQIEQQSQDTTQRQTKLTKMTKSIHNQDRNALEQAEMFLNLNTIQRDYNRDWTLISLDVDGALDSSPFIKPPQMSLLQIQQYHFDEWLNGLTAKNYGSTDHTNSIKNEFSTRFRYGLTQSTIERYLKSPHSNTFRSMGQSATKYLKQGLLEVGFYSTDLHSSTYEAPRISTQMLTNGLKQYQPNGMRRDNDRTSGALWFKRREESFFGPNENDPNGQNHSPYHHNHYKNNYRIVSSYNDQSGPYVEASDLIYRSPMNPWSFLSIEDPVDNSHDLSRQCEPIFAALFASQCRHSYEFFSSKHFTNRYNRFRHDINLFDQQIDESLKEITIQHQKSSDQFRQHYHRIADLAHEDSKAAVDTAIVIDNITENVHNLMQSPIYTNMIDTSYFSTLEPRALPSNNHHHNNTNQSSEVDTDNNESSKWLDSFAIPSVHKALLAVMNALPSLATPTTNPIFDSFNRGRMGENYYQAYGADNIPVSNTTKAQLSNNNNNNNNNKNVRSTSHKSNEDRTYNALFPHLASTLNQLESKKNGNGSDQDKNNAQSNTTLSTPSQQKDQSTASNVAQNQHQIKTAPGATVRFWKQGPDESASQSSSPRQAASLAKSQKSPLMDIDDNGDLDLGHIDNMYVQNYKIDFNSNGSSLQSSQSSHDNSNKSDLKSPSTQSNNKRSRSTRQILQDQIRQKQQENEAEGRKPAVGKTTVKVKRNNDGSKKSSPFSSFPAPPPGQERYQELAGTRESRIQATIREMEIEIELAKQRKKQEKNNENSLQPSNSFRAPTFFDPTMGSSGSSNNNDIEKSTPQKSLRQLMKEQETRQNERYQQMNNDLSSNQSNLRNIVNNPTANLSGPNLKKGMTMNAVGEHSAPQQRQHASESTIKKLNKKKPSIDSKVSEEMLQHFITQLLKTDPSATSILSPFADRQARTHLQELQATETAVDNNRHTNAAKKRSNNPPNSSSQGSKSETNGRYSHTKARQESYLEDVVASGTFGKQGLIPDPPRQQSDQATSVAAQLGFRRRR